MLIMAIRLDTLLTDPTVLTEMVLALDAENEGGRGYRHASHPVTTVRSESLIIYISPGYLYIYPQAGIQSCFQKHIT
jgi:hypothetical protein